MIDYQKLRRYIQIRTVVNIIEKGVLKKVASEFRPCKKEDFIDNQIANKFENFKYNLCPETEVIDKHYIF